jgi:transposase InsO family protein
MPDRLAMVVAGALPGVSVTALCTELGISRQTYYRLKRRYDLEGPAGLEPRSRRPHHSPGKTGLAMELEILRLREELPVHRGAAAIAAELDRRGYPAPAPATVHRILRGAGLVRPSPQKRPRSSWQRFTYSDPNGCWQTDATDWQLADRTRVTICDVLDDHSRVLAAALVGPAGAGATTTLAVAAFTHAAAQWGLPARVLSDNGSCFGGVDRRGTFPRLLAELGVELIHSRIAHPQTCGKIERFHQTLKQHLAALPAATTVAELQAQIDRFLDHYNHHRRHSALTRSTPAQAHAARPAATPGPAHHSHTGRVTVRTLTADIHATLSYDQITINMGPDHAGHRYTLVNYGARLIILDAANVPVRTLTLTPGKRYYPAPTDSLLSPMS